MSVAWRLVGTVSAAMGRAGISEASVRARKGWGPAEREYWYRKVSCVTIGCR